jgi:hypothetical protein
MPEREVHCTDGIAWLETQHFGPETAIVTSLPDSSEVPALGFAGWKHWFTSASELICRQLSDSGVAIFYQTDVKLDGRWVDKAFLVSLGADRAGSHCLWHKVVCRAPAGLTTFGRPSYSHLLCFSRSARLEKAQSFADVLPRLGDMTWARAMGLEACHAIAQFLVKHTPCTTVVDPFCGVGTMLAVANAHGLNAVGVELSPKRAAQSRELVVPLRT